MKEIVNFYVAGVKFYDLKKCAKNIEEGTELVLEPDPMNPYDSNAIKILYENTMLGHVPAKFCASVLANMEVVDVKCVVVSIDMSAKTWNQLKVSINEYEEFNEKTNV